MLKMLIRMLHAARISQLAEYEIVTTNNPGMTAANMLLFSQYILILSLLFTLIDLGILVNDAVRVCFVHCRQIKCCCVLYLPFILQRWHLRDSLLLSFSRWSFRTKSKFNLNLF